MGRSVSVPDRAAIDLNADVGEGFGGWGMGDDEALLDLITSANVACGFHAGDPSIMRRTCELAVSRGVRIGAHIGYRDLAGFGRRHLDVEPEVLHDEVLYQVAALDGCARAVGTAVRYVKPHGALYHRCSDDPEAAAAVVAALRAHGGGLAVLGAPGAELLRQAEQAGLEAVAEGFADRAYDDAGRLIPRSQDGAVLEHDAAVAQAVAIARGGAVATLCLHGDTPGAVALARAVRAALEDAGVDLAPFS